MIGSHKRVGRVRGELKNLVRFVVAETTYSFDVQIVEEVVHPQLLTPLPHMAHGVVGVFDHRGRVTPVVDLRTRFGLEATSQRSTKWVLTRTQHGLVGFVVDRVLDVVGTSGASSQAPSVGASDATRAVRGVTNVGGQLVFACDENQLASIVADLELPERVD
jgi:purine-binding chemotaxis protein CheW